MPSVRPSGGAAVWRRPAPLPTDTAPVAGDSEGAAPAKYAQDILRDYVQSCQLNNGNEAEDIFSEGVERVREHLLGSTEAGCLICLEDIKHTGDPLDALHAAETSS